MLEFDKKSNLLMTNRYQYSLQDVAEPNLYRELYDYESIPKVAFNMRHVPENMPDEIWMTDTTFRDGQQSRAPYTVDQIVHLFSLLFRHHPLEGVRGTAYEQIINTGMLRCMSKAVYEEKPKGHYGLVLQDYAHFTSPIRRYPDLAIHRIMTAQLKGTDKDTMILRYSEFAEDVSKQASEREVIAMQIERKAEDCYKAEYARRHLGECYEGTISGVTQRGLFIELDNGVEGFVPASSLTPSGTSLTEGVRLTDPASGKSWSLGDKMMITIVRADVNLGKIDFEVAPAAKN